MPYDYYGWGSRTTSSTINHGSGSWTINYDILGDVRFGDVRFSVHEEPDYNKEDAAELVKFIDEFKTK